MLSKRGFLFASAALLMGPVEALGGDTLVIAATTSMKDSELANYIGERYLAASGVALKFISVASEAAASFTFRRRCQCLDRQPLWCRCEPHESPRGAIRVRVHAQRLRACWPES